MAKLNRRDFLYTLSAFTAGVRELPLCASPAPVSKDVKAISGSWFEFQHNDPVEAVDWNATSARFTCEQWDAKISEISDLRMEYLVLMSTALNSRAFYSSRAMGRWPLACPDPLETVLAAADKHGVKFFVGGGFYGDWRRSTIISDPVIARKRLKAIEEITNRYAHHQSFHGWYWPNEAFINHYFSDEFIQYVNNCSRLARQLMPKARLMIAPYGTRVAVPDDRYVRQLASLDVDIVAYQDEVGVRKSKVEETSAFYEGLRRAHDRAGRSVIWADVEVFEFEGAVYRSALIPASFDRVVRQLEAVSSWVEAILIYQYQGMMNMPGSTAFAGSPASTKLYTAYSDWLKKPRSHLRLDWERG